MPFETFSLVRASTPMANSLIPSDNCQLAFGTVDFYLLLLGKWQLAFGNWLITWPMATRHSAIAIGKVFTLCDIYFLATTVRAHLGPFGSLSLRVRFSTPSVWGSYLASFKA